VVAIFSRGPDVLVELQSRLKGMGYDAVWLNVYEFGSHIPLLMAAEAIIVDEVDREFRQCEAVCDLEDWLLYASGAPPRLFLEDETDHHLDRYALPYGNTLVHHMGETLDDQKLYDVCHRRLGRHADQSLALA
jgi:hypothetical protein